MCSSQLFNISEYHSSAGKKSEIDSSDIVSLCRCHYSCGDFIFRMIFRTMFVSYSSKSSNSFDAI